MTFAEREAWAYLVRAANGPSPVVAAALARYGPVETAERVVRGNVVAQARTPVPWPDSGAHDLANVARIGGRLVTPADPDWPLFASRYPTKSCGFERAIRALPVALWVLGSGPLAPMLQPAAVSVVGTRLPSQYGTRVAVELTRQLLKERITVVAAGDLGIGSAVMFGALSTDARRLVVVARSGLQVSLASSTGRLQSSVLAAGGLVVSEFAPDTKSSLRTRADRARLMALLSSGTVVVETGLRSGSASMHCDSSRQMGGFVGAVPGPVTSPQSAGTHEMLRHNAVLVADAADVRRLLQRLSLIHI